MKRIVTRALLVLVVTAAMFGAVQAATVLSHAPAASACSGDNC
jgi:hypothetical protein